MTGLCLLALLVSYAGVGVALWLGLSYEMLGHGLHPALCVVFAAVSIGMGIAGFFLQGRR